MKIDYTFESNETNEPLFRITTGDHAGTVFKVNNISFRDDVEDGEDNCLIDFDIVSSDTVSSTDEGEHVEEFMRQVGEIVIDVLESAVKHLEEKAEDSSTNV